MARAVKDGLSLLIGAGVGVGLMYLFDPELGAKRRKTISKHAGDSVSGATDAVRNLASTVGDHASSLPSIGSLVSPATGALKQAYEQIGSHLQDHFDNVHAKASNALDDTQDAGQSAADSAKDKLRSMQTKLVKDLSSRVAGLSGPAKEKYAKALKDLTLQLGRDEDHHYVGQTACALGSLAIGAGAVYFLDPDKGHDRRDNMASTVSTTVSEIGTFFRKIGTRLIHQGQGVADQALDHLSPVIDKASDLKDQYIGGVGSQKQDYETPSQSY